jgi:hypothetical protein
MIDVYGATHIGKTHVQESMPNQDSYCAIEIVKPDASGALIAIADGHGSKPHKYSDVGSKIAISVVQGMFEAVITLESTSQEFYEKVGKAILHHWQKRILEYHHKHHSNEVFSPLLYGTTLRFAMVDDEHNCFLFSVGDGITALFDEAGEPTFFENSHESNLDEPTLSLCNARLSDLKCLSCKLDNHSAVLVATDGFATHLDTAFNLKDHLAVHIMGCSGGILKANLKGLARSYSQDETFDDSTISLIKLRSKLSLERQESETVPEELEEKTS